MMMMVMVIIIIIIIIIIIMRNCSCEHFCIMYVWLFDFCVEIHIQGDVLYNII